MSATIDRSISAEELHALLQGDNEIALLDVREPRATAEEGSLLLAVSAPLGRIEFTVDGLVPRRSTAVVVLDRDGGDLAQRAAKRLGDLGYRDVRWLDGGVEGWAKAGYKVHTGGTHVVGQAFGEWVEQAYGTPHLTVEELRSRQAAGEDVVLLDSRPLVEFVGHSLPGGVSIPGAELVYRAAEAVQSPDSLVVVNCAGRTRSIIGAQALINAGLPNQVVALEGGTQSWILADLALEHGSTDVVPPPSPAALAQASAAARRIAERFGVQTLDAAGLARFRQESDTRTLYLFDVRTPEEYEQGHLPGARSAPSWDLAPWVFRHAATHHARLVLVDGPDLVRAVVSASWLVQIGWGEVYVISHDWPDVALETGPDRPTVLGLPESGVSLLDADELRGLLDDRQGTQVVDLAASTAYRDHHVPGSVFALRSRLADTVDQVPGTGRIVLTSEDGLLARIAAPEVAAATDRPVAVLDGGTDAWVRRGLPVQAGEGHLLHDPDDAPRSPWSEEDLERKKAGFRQYLSWEVGLVEELRQDDTVPFVSFA